MSNLTEAVRRGDIVLVDFGTKDGAEQSGIRPAVVVQNDTGNKYSPTAIVCPMTTKTKREITTHVLLGPKDGTDKLSILLCEQISTVDKTKFIKKLGKIEREKIEEVNRAVRISLGLE